MDLREELIQALVSIHVRHLLDQDRGRIEEWEKHADSVLALVEKHKLARKQMTSEACELARRDRYGERKVEYTDDYREPDNNAGCSQK